MEARLWVSPAWFTRWILTEVYISHEKNLFLLGCLLVLTQLQSNAHHHNKLYPMTSKRHITWGDRRASQARQPLPPFQSTCHQGSHPNQLIFCFDFAFRCALKRFHIESDLRQNLNTKYMTRKLWWNVFPSHFLLVVMCTGRSYQQKVYILMHTCNRYNWLPAQHCIWPFFLLPPPQAMSLRKPIAPRVGLVQGWALPNSEP